MYKLDSEKAEEPDIKFPASVGFFYDPTEAGNLISGSLTTLTSLTVWITTNSEKFVKRWEYQTTLPVSWEACIQVKKQQLEPDMEQQTDSKLWKE